MRSPANKVVAENCRAGNAREEWDVNGTGDTEIQGFATDVSVNLGGTVQFKIKSSSPRYRVDVYRTGWYGGRGARLVREDDAPASWRSEGNWQAPSTKPEPLPHRYDALGIGALRDAMKEKRARQCARQRSRIPNS